MNTQYIKQYTHRLEKLVKPTEEGSDSSVNIPSVNDIMWDTTDTIYDNAIHDRFTQDMYDYDKNVKTIFYEFMDAVSTSLGWDRLPDDIRTTIIDRKWLNYISVDTSLDKVYQNSILDNELVGAIMGNIPHQIKPLNDVSNQSNHDHYDKEKSLLAQPTHLAIQHRPQRHEYGNEASYTQSVNDYNTLFTVTQNINDRNRLLYEEQLNAIDQRFWGELSHNLGWSDLTDFEYGLIVHHIKSGMKPDELGDCTYVNLITIARTYNAIVDEIKKAR